MASNRNRHILSTQSLAETAHDIDADVAHAINAEGSNCRSNDLSCTARPTLRMRRVHCRTRALLSSADHMSCIQYRYAPVSVPSRQRRPCGCALCFAAAPALCGRTPTFCLTKDNIGARSVSARHGTVRIRLVHSPAARQGGVPALLATTVALLTRVEFTARWVANGSGGQSVRTRRGSRLDVRGIHVGPSHLSLVLMRQTRQNRRMASM
jgi:hypothetical protein